MIVPRLLVGHEWYEGLASEVWLESTYEAVIQSNAELLFPTWYLVPFKTMLEGADGVRKPDFALIDRQYRQWWIVEVELAHHSLNRHVLPQVDAFRTARLTRSHAAYLSARQPELDEKSLWQMMLGAPPRVLVTVNQPRPNWVQPLAAKNAILMIVEPFRSHQNRIVLRVNGEQPEAAPEIVSQCRRHLARMFRVDSPAKLGGQHNDHFEIEFAGEVSMWVRLDVADAVYLRSMRGNVLGDFNRMALIRDDDDRLHFET
jgi:hypothetical protein